MNGITYHYHRRGEYIREARPGSFPASRGLRKRKKSGTLSTAKVDVRRATPKSEQHLVFFKNDNKKGGTEQVTFARQLHPAEITYRGVSNRIGVYRF